MSSRTSTPSRRSRPRRAARTAGSVRSAAERAVERVLGSDEAFALLIRRLEEAGWHVEREVASAPDAATPTRAATPTLTPPARAR